MTGKDHGIPQGVADGSYGKKGEGVSHVKSGGEGLLVAHVTSEVTGWTTVGVVPVSGLMKDTEVLRTYLILIGVICVGPSPCCCMCSSPTGSPSRCAS